MRLSLSSGAAPGALLEELLAACGRRGLAGLELAEGHGHELSLSTPPGRAAAMARLAGDAGVEICGFRRPTLDRAEIEAGAAIAGAVGGPLVVPLEGVDRTALPLAAEVFSRAGARLILTVEGDPRVAEAVRRLLEPLPHSPAIGLAWNIRPGAEGSIALDEMLEAAGGTLEYLRLYGGGPESHAQSGFGVGPLFAALALRRYVGPVVLTPSQPTYHYAWNAWLGRAGGWGCGSKKSDPALFTVEKPAYALPEQQ